jgi:AraC-like DNA-binding protein
MISFDPDRPDFAPYGFTCVRWTPSPMRRPDHHNEVEINFLETGSLTYLLGGQKAFFRAGRVSLFWAAIPHQILAFDPATRYFVATIPFSWFLQFKLPDVFVQSLLRGDSFSDPDDSKAVSDEGLFSQWERDLKKPQAQTTAIVMLEMEARLLRLATSLPTGADGKGLKRGKRRNLHSGGLNKVEQMACLIAQRYTEPLTVDEIGKAVGLHPNYAMSLFKKTFGTTLIDYLTHHRISHTQRLLATTDEKIVDIAYRSGFNSISRFNEAFRKACNCSPREYRQHHETGEN